MTKSISVGVIGAGVMGEAIIAALISFGVSPKNITISEKRKDRSDELCNRYGINVAEIDDNVSSAQVLLLVVKPQDLVGVLEEISADFLPGCLVVSFVAGKKISYIADLIGTGANPVIRVMPNTPTLVGVGMSAISCCELVTADQREFVLGFLGAVGKVIEIDEELQDAVTATSGSGPAYFFRFVEAMVDGAKELGLSHEIATMLTVQTMLGAAKLLENSGKSASTLRENVTSPNGTTAAALASFDTDQISTMVASAMKAAHNRSQELA